VVAGAAKLVGKKIPVTVGRVLDGVAFALPSDHAEVPDTITFEAEAEKPTRAAPAKPAGSRKKPGRASAEAEAVADATAEPEPEPAAAGEAVTDDEQPKKKRTRRGTRGGRGRKKATPPATVATEEPAADEAVEVEQRKRRPKIHVPPAEPLLVAEETVEPGPDAVAEESDSDPATDGVPKRKRTRRGTRGGRKRRKTSANGGPTEAAKDASTGSSEDEAEPAEYVPMAEWIEDFEASGERRAG
jgi:ribonuclease E